jgi:replicative DNA helicase
MSELSNDERVAALVRRLERPLAQVAGNGAGDAALIDASRLVTGDTFILDAPAELELLWGDDENALWAEGQALELVGPSGVGKTTIAGQLTLARIGLRETVLGFPVRQANRVLYLAGDRPPQIAAAMRRLVTEDDRVALRERLVVWRGPPPADFARNVELLLELARKADADCVFLDSLKDVALGLSDDEVGAGLNSAMQRALVEGVEIGALHHQRKGQGGTKPKTLEDVYGSTWITAGAGSVLLLWGVAGDSIVELSQLKPLRDPVGPWKLEHDHDAGTTTVVRGSADPLAMLRGAPQGLTVEEIARVLSDKSQPSDNDKARARMRLGRHVTRGEARREEAHVGGPAGSTPARYFAVETPQ